MEERLNPRLTASPRSAIRQFAQLAAATPGCISLTLGEPDFPTPLPVCDAAKASLDRGQTHYIPNNGSPALCRAIAAFESEAHGLTYGPDEVIVTVGATEALFIALLGILEPGDEVLVPTPAFVLYQCIVGIAGGVFVPVDTAKTGFQLTEAQLRAAVTAKTKAIVLNSPNNPTGCVLNEESLAAVVQIAREFDLFVLCDEVYRQLHYAPEIPQFSTRYPDLKDRVLVIQSFSKPYAMTGWRLGYCMADAKLMDRIQVFHQYCVTSVPSFVQRACVTALETDTSEVVEIFRKRRDYVYQRLVDMGLDVEKPEGAFYMFVDIRKFGMDSNTFCTRMLKEGLVGVIPGIHFGTEGFMRLSYCYSDADLKEGLDRIEKFIKSL